MYSVDQPTKTAKPVDGSLKSEGIPAPPSTASALGFVEPENIIEKWSKEKRDELAKLLVKMIEETEANTAAWVRRGEEHERLWRDEAPREKPHDGVSTSRRQFSLSYVKGGALISKVSGAVTGSKPYANCYDVMSSEEPRRQDAKERLMHFFLSRAGFDKECRTAGKNAYNWSKGIYRLTYNPGDVSPELAQTFDAADKIVGSKKRQKKAGLQIDSIHPKHFMVYPYWVEELDDAAACGHRFYRRKAWVEAQDEYFEDAVECVKGYDEVKPAGYSTEDSKIGQQTAVRESDKAVEIWQLCYLADLDEDGTEEYYLCTVARAESELLYAEPYDATRPPYFDVWFETSQGQFWDSASLAYHVQGLQHLFNDLNNAFVDAAQLMAKPPGFAKRGTFGIGDKVIRYNLGEIVEVDGDVPVFPSTNIRIDAIPPMLEKVEQRVDAVTRISRLGSSMQLRSDATATEAAGLMANQQEDIREFHANFAIGHERLVEFAQELLAKNYADWSVRYQGYVPDISLDELVKPVEWVMNGRIPTKNPQAIIQQSSLLYGMAQGDQMGATGLSVYDLTAEIVAKTDIDNKERVQMTREQTQLWQEFLQFKMMMEQMQQAQAEAQAKGGGGEVSPEGKRIRGRFGGLVGDIAGVESNPGVSGPVTEQSA